jgi:hypothetical protein
MWRPNSEPNYKDFLIKFIKLINHHKNIMKCIDYDKINGDKFTDFMNFEIKEG